MGGIVVLLVVLVLNTYKPQDMTRYGGRKLQAMNTGHDGSLSTAHANSARHLSWRLETMALMSNVDLPRAPPVVRSSGVLAVETDSSVEEYTTLSVERTAILERSVYLRYRTGAKPRPSRRHDDATRSPR